MTDAEALRRAQSGDKAAVEMLLRRYDNIARSTTEVYFLPDAELDDLIQIARIGLWRAIMSCDPELKLPAYAKCVVKRHVITAVKTATRLKQRQLTEALSLEALSKHDEEFEASWTPRSPSTEDVVLAKMDGDELWRLLDASCSRKEFTILTEYALGRSYQEIAARLDINCKSIDNALSRVKRKCSRYESIDCPE